MNTALILAGGLDPRFHMDIPKQFVNVNNKPVIIYTLEIFQNHPDIDEIIVTCLAGRRWCGYMENSLISQS